VDNIVALATFPSSTSALNIIRISGDSSKDIVEKIFSSSSLPLRHRTICYGDIVNPSNKSKVDDVILLPYFAPKTFTGEDLFEIICHGGNLIYKQIISLVIAEGARFAETGEFTKRAYINKKIDLSQAEAINDIINSENDIALELARKNLDGVLGKEVAELKELFIGFLSEIETSINFPEDEVVAVSSEKLNKLLSSLQRFLDSSAFQEDINIEDVLILGEPNVGKSSLLNKLADQEKSIVTDISGTTRDLIEHHIDISGIKLNLVDTAGLNKDSTDVVEGIGIKKALDRLKTAHTVLYMLDATVPFCSDNFKLFYSEHLENISATVIFLINKTENESGPDLSFLKSRHTIISISVKQGLNIDKVRESLLSSIDEYSEEVLSKSFFLNMRQRELLEKSIALVAEAKDLCDAGETEEVIAGLIHAALLYVERIVGNVSDEELLESIFSNFCIGK